MSATKVDWAGFTLRPLVTQSGCVLWPSHPRSDLDGDDRSRNRDVTVLGVLGHEGALRTLCFGWRISDSRFPIHSHPPQKGPILVIVVDQQTSRRSRPDVLQPTKI